MLQARKTVINVLGNDVDPQGAALITKITATTSPTVNGGSVTILSNYSILYAPKLEFFGTDTFSYKACNGEIGRAVQQECRDRSRMPSSA
eukprot:TRINITY_DN90666_c0_g1_i1.p1 TRINITY_DN90666_c0_g1~~TRINITY_DN90666_c0_g1_i1.p1  ORF type:complete len:104 (+),score=22.57 TRINITY_DN90666_c0_g1_i1:43-312(+)